MKTRFMQSVLLGAVLHQLAGCMSPAMLAPNVDDGFGDSINALKAYQTLNPAASANTANPAMDGRAAQDVIGRYYKSYSVPVPHQNVLMIGVGGGAQ